MLFRSRSESADEFGNYRWEYAVDVHGEEIGKGEELTARNAALEAELAIACHVLTADPRDVIGLLSGTQQQISDRTGVPQSTISDWRSDSDTGMARSTRHLILALIGCQRGREGWRFDR